MKNTLVFSLLVALLLSACGGGDDSSKVRAVTPVLRIEAKLHDGKYSLFLPGGDAPASESEILEAVYDYSEIINNEAGLKGRDKYMGHGLNPVEYLAPPEAPIEVFTRFVELCSSAMVVQVRVVLRATGEVPEPVTVELPRDESFGPMARHWFTAEVVRRDGDVHYEVGLAPIERLEVPGSTHGSSTLHSGPFNRRLYNSLRTKVLTTFLAIDLPSDRHIGYLTIHYPEEEARESWVEVFLLLDVAQELARRRSSQIQPRLEVDVFGTSIPPEVPVEYPDD